MTTHTKKTGLTVILALAWLTGACATATGDRPPLAQGVSRAVKGTPAHVVLQGPAEVHAWSEFDGGAIYTAPAITGTDQDCATTATENRLALPRDRSFSYKVHIGEVACVVSEKRSSIELLWHASGRSDGPSVPTLAMRH